MTIAAHEAAPSGYLAAPSAAARDSQRSRRFVHAALLSCLCLQRFGLLLNQSVLFLSLPVFLALVAWMVITGQAEVTARGLLCLGLFMFWTLLSLEVALLFPDERVQISLSSLGDVLVTYALWAVRPTRRFDAAVTLDIFLFYARLCAVCGIAQFALQFAGLRWFEFSDMFPALSPMLAERHYAFNATIAYGSPILRSNGFFLLEPSMFSQVLALAMCIEFFVKRRHRFLPVYGLAYLVSFSGTGALSLIVAVVIYGTFSTKHLIRIGGFALLSVAAVVLLAWTAPQLFQMFASRATEFQRTGSSAYARYAGQIDVIRPFIQETRALIGYGPGATERSLSFNLGSASPLLKLLIDYGVAGLIAFAALASVVARAGRPIVVILCFVMFQLGGGYLLFSPFVVLMTLLCAWTGEQKGAPGHAALEAEGDRSEADLVSAVRSQDQLRLPEVRHQGGRAHGRLLP